MTLVVEGFDQLGNNCTQLIGILFFAGSFA